MRHRIELLALLAPLLVAVAPDRAMPADEGNEPKRMVLVELYTSQGCDMCPTAENVLGALAERDPRIVPIAFHVDYFNDPWKDVFSEPLYSQRQMAYNQLYTKAKNPEYGLYYTPMMMIDGEQSVNGRDPAAARAAIRQALARKPAVALDVNLALEPDGLSGTAAAKVTSRSPRAEKTPLLVCAVLREDGVVTDIPAGENAGKSLVARFPARKTKYEFIELDGKSPTTERFPFAVEPAWNRKNLRLAVFVQDKRTGAVHQAADLPWRSTRNATASNDGQGGERRALRSSFPTPRNPRRVFKAMKTTLFATQAVLGLALGAATVMAPGMGLEAHAQDAKAPTRTQPGLRVGEKAARFTLEDQAGKQRSLDEFLAKGKVALVFYRSADW